SPKPHRRRSGSQCSNAQWRILDGSHSFRRLVDCSYHWENDSFGTRFQECRYQEVLRKGYTHNRENSKAPSSHDLACQNVNSKWRMLIIQLNQFEPGVRKHLHNSFRLNNGYKARRSDLPPGNISFNTG